MIWSWKATALLTGMATQIIGCSGARVTIVKHAVQTDHAIQSIALNPSGGILADAVGMEFLNRGYTVLDTQETSNLLVRMNASEVEWMEPAQLSKLREREIDAILIVRAASNSDGLPVSASARLVSTQTGRVIGGVAWENAKAGAGGSPLDHIVKKGVIGAAKDIVRALMKSAGLSKRQD